MSEFCPYNYESHPARLEYPFIYPMPSDKELDRRWAAIRKVMKEQKFDCLVVNAPDSTMPALNNHLYYMSNYVPFANHGTYFVFPLKGEPQLGVHDFIGPQFRHVADQTTRIKEIVGSLQPIRDVVSKLKRLKLEHGRIGIIGYRSGTFPASDYRVLREGFPNATLEDGTGALLEAMNEISRSSEEELGFLRKACEILDRSFEAAAAAFKPGVKEYELWAVVEHAIISNGGWYGHFMLATVGPASIFPRAPASHYALTEGDIAIFEINAMYAGISGQICYAISLGRPKSEVEAMYDFGRELYQFALAELEKSRTFMDIELELANRIHRAGYEPMTPQIHVYNQSFVMPMGSPPQPGDYFTVHPNFCNKDYSVGAKFGDAVRITKDGKVERLQKTPAKLNIITP